MTINFYDDIRVVLSECALFDLKKTFECGQCFRFDIDENGVWHGIAYGKEIFLYQNGNTVVMYPISKKEFQDFWWHFFDLERDYDAVNHQLSKNEILKKASEFGKGIRILRQEPWEALCSFIISQNNNIPRIKGIINRLCEAYGERIGNSYTFPSAKTLSRLTAEDLAPLRSGFRAKYIIDAAKKVSSGEIKLEQIATLNSDEAREILTTIYGVGNKVADCTLLFGMAHIDVCPKDVWIKRALSILFDGDFPECAREYAGIAQQYLFYYARETKMNI